MLVQRFENGTLPCEDFHHIEHVKVACAYLDRYGADEAARRLAAALHRFADRAGRPGKFDPALTRAWVAAIDDARRAHPEARTFEALVRARPELLDRSAVQADR